MENFHLWIIFKRSMLNTSLMLLLTLKVKDKIKQNILKRIFFCFFDKENVKSNGK